MDPLALRWHSFADDEAQPIKRHVRSPDQTSPPPPLPPPVVRRAATPMTNQDDASHPSSLHTKKTLSRFGLNILKEELPNCYCRMPAERVYTAEFGPILECGRFREAAESATSSRMVCGFHVHEYAWRKFRGIVDYGHFLKSNHHELKSCSFFNFTFCTLFDVENEYECRTPTVPLCSCKRPVIQKTETRGITPMIVFVCKNADIDGARPKCSWLLEANRTPLPKPKYPLHAIIEREEYFNRMQAKMDEIKEKNLIPAITAQPSAQVVKAAQHPSLVPTSVMGKRRLRPVTDECALKAQLERLRNELAIKRSKNQQLDKERQKMDRLKKDIDACQTKNYRLKRELHNSMALSLLCEERIDAIETELSEMEVKRLIKDAQGMVVDDTHCKKCRERCIEYAVAPCFHFGKNDMSVAMYVV
jgi:hypothetical protein